MERNHSTGGFDDGCCRVQLVPDHVHVLLPLTIVLAPDCSVTASSSTTSWRASSCAMNAGPPWGFVDGCSWRQLLPSHTQPSLRVPASAGAPPKSKTPDLATAGM